MLTLEEIKDKMKDRKLVTVAAATGMNYQTVQRLMAGDKRKVSYDTVKKLSDYLEGKDFLQSDLSRS
jgi:DNA-binding Xre family transcriptional regulator